MSEADEGGKRPTAKGKKQPKRNSRTQRIPCKLDGLVSWWTVVDGFERGYAQSEGKLKLLPTPATHKGVVGHSVVTLLRITAKGCLCL
jgi:hypothetical protein